MSKKEDIQQEENTVEENATIEQAEGNVEETKEEIAEPTVEELVKAEKDKYLRLFAEFENYKKRTTKERIELFKTAGKDIIVSMLPVVDDFDRGMVEISKSEDEELVKGVALIQDKLIKTLEQKGLTVVEVNQGDTFDADTHEAITQIPAPTEDLKGKIIDVVEKGYKLGDTIIRFPKVVIGQA
ncbi:nucleotide exchange factor GrpE [Wenyingzhuangia sp. 2_MG-2023]|uniref:nucleotide exchange factor GrpE n=1 Tax=Wenyingzhuangia sp. 2_MG-2023 TaxID=3062639 RepID=UPI0026E43471|nr:nucleotide exchange factor GrpE [Wenyingzhuangia sp. 2_MG-2023]MDO6738552.1 nucleotide exchange factor GrpE [Wenyingzhuangia sp. 2_MG-2023]MDO6803225.1 nucleotide exchange factor GrpE [Wenyingzhuangia sp. 1_MG-2023]